MTAAHFKQHWKAVGGSHRKWITYTGKEMERVKLLESTKEFLKEGFPVSAPPFLSFRPIGGKLCTAEELYGIPLKKAQSFVLFGVAGDDHICFDTNNNDELVLVDQENLEVKLRINTNIEQLAQCLIAFQSFVQRIKRENGADAYINSIFTDEQFIGLEEEFRRISPTIFQEGPFWKKELWNLLQSRK